HRMAPADTRVLNPDMTTTTDLLDDALRLVTGQGYECIALDEVPSRLRGSRSGRFVAFTFDDGYRDTLTTALPVFRAHRVPFCVYITTGMIDRTVDYWWGALARLITSASRLEIDALGLSGQFSTTSWPDKQRAYCRLESWIHEDLESRSA